MARWIRRILAAVVLAAAVVVSWPQALGLQTAPVFGHIVALRGAIVVAGIAGFLALGLLRLIPGLRLITGTLAFVLVLMSVGNGAIVAWRGVSGTPLTPDASSITVLEWNTEGEKVSADSIAQLALRVHADIIALPETTDDLGEKVALAMKAAGSPMWSNTVSFNRDYKALNTTILLSPILGEYTVTSYSGSGPPLNTNTAPTVVAKPTDGTGPTIVAVHAVAPREGQMGNWRSDLAWLATQCSGNDVILAGDFNSTIDNMAGLGVDGGHLGRCVDAGASAKGAGLGTWPTKVPSMLGSPIDHVLATPNYRISGFQVLSEYDSAGSDHRPIITQLRLKG
ncbi:MAG TPA: endonuclease/exonuclease/phosphatase family protein [Microbacteriaceae bacterium]|nr:endonuclease/exonuclease/phosphatase family protein [Microbacteriaceae bacterium]